MDLKQNPFHILAASPRDNRRRITDLADERSLLLDSSEVMAARSELTNPRKRLSAEIAWLPGLGPKRVGAILSLLDSSPIELLKVDKLLPIARANALAAGLSFLTSPDSVNEQSSDDIAYWILEISSAFEDIDAEELVVIINEERIVSGFPEVSDRSVVADAIQEQQRYFRKVIKSALDSLKPMDLVDAVTVVVETATNYGEEHGSPLIDDLVDLYEVGAQEFLDNEENNINVLVERLEAAVSAEKSDSTIAPMVNQLIKIVENWDAVAQPIQISTMSRGLTHEASKRVASTVRGLAIQMFNEHGKLDFSQQLTTMLQEVFAEVVEVAERVAEDADALDDIAEQQSRLVEDAKINAEKTRREITYEADVGAVFKDKLRISPEGIEWKGRNWDLNSITRVRWGGTRNSVNGIPTGTTYIIGFGDKSNYVSIELRREATYNSFIERLWKAVGVRLLTEYLEGLRDGQQYLFGLTVVSDLGIALRRKKLFGSNESIFCPWGELVIWNGAGAFCIGKKGDKKLVTSLSYQDYDNIHILELAIRMLLKSGGSRLSSIFEG